VRIEKENKSREYLLREGTFEGRELEKKLSQEKTDASEALRERGIFLDEVRDLEN